MDTLSIVHHKSKYSAETYRTFAINGTAIEIWLPNQNPSSELDLISAHEGLNDEQETALIWDRIFSTAPNWSCIVPLLVCPDDVDLSCTVIVAEQLSSEMSITWKRFGLLLEPTTLESPSVDWYPDIRTVEFKRDNFMKVIEEFRSAVNVDLGLG